MSTGPNPSGMCFCGCGELAPMAKKTNLKKGLVAGRPARFIFGHQRRKSPVEYLVDATTGCWMWQRAANDMGYGQMTVNDRRVYAHRVFYECHVGPIPAGHVIDHTCGRPACVNPAHLEAVTNGENLRRGSRGLGSVRQRAGITKAAP